MTVIEIEIGTTVRVRGSDRLMRLMAVERVYDSSRRPGRLGGLTETAFTRPLEGGREQGFPMDEVEPVCDHQGPLDVRSDGKHCSHCGALLYGRGPA
ncbi:hypothetical protein [Streptomyces axinellae]|uniref:Uncharacterized protein n=1 Tax=Streptomyces axinellae TaxID=552788 RepID=A0ABP6C1Y3_9ACTN